MFIHSFMIYKRLAHLLRDLNIVMRNFVWTDLIDSSKIVLVAWSKCCLPLKVYWFLILHYLEN